MKVLIAEDDDHIRNGIVELLEDEGYQVIPARDGREALQLFQNIPPDFVILDIMMPHINGYDVCRTIRSQYPTLPVVFLSAKSEEIDKVLGLELGADDYISKPFGIKEFLARIRAVSRRSIKTPTPSSSSPSPDPTTSNPTSDRFFLNDLEVIPGELRAKRGQVIIELSRRDVLILALFHRNPGKVLDRNTIFNECWGVHYFPNSRTLDQHISQLRKKIEQDPKSPTIIHTIHGAGYRYE